MRQSRKQQGSGRIVGHSRAADNSAEFHGYFSSQFLQRYADLFQALAQPVQHVALLNSFTDVNDCDELGLEAYYRSGVISCLRYPQPQHSYLPPPLCPYTQLKQFYWLDFASVLPPLLLAVEPHHTVLDMCAAPGGKSLIIAQQLLKGSTASQQQQQQHKQHQVLQEVNGSIALTADLLEQLAVDSHTKQTCTLEPAPQDGAPQHILQQEAGAIQDHQQQQQQQLQQPAQQQDEGQRHQGRKLPFSASIEQLDSPHFDADSSSNHSSQDDLDPKVTSCAQAAASRGRLVCNELDPVRRQRLQTVINTYVPGSSRRHVRVVGHDAAKHWSTFESEMYDRVLLDAPCSSERHVVSAACEAGGVVSASSWSIGHCKQLAALQLKLLLAGLRALKPGGRLVYSTCSLADVENDQVVQKALQQAAAAAGLKGNEGCHIRSVPVDEWQMDPELEDLVGGDRTHHGLLCLPDKKGSGPIYISMFEKTAS